MGLTEYHKKRDFKKTAEPRGKVGKRAKKSGLKFVVQKHDASRLHYDFRLEYDGVLKSWAVPKGPSMDPGRKALAVQVEDHPIDYGDFEGVIPAGEYGGGTVLLWDRGTWEPLGDAGEGLAAGKIHFNLSGEKLKGEFALVRMYGRAGDNGKNWLLFKVKDKYAKKGEITETATKSVKTKRSLDQIAGDRDDVWSSDAKKTAKLSNAKKGAWPKDFSPQLAVLSDHPPKGDQWIHEIKFDGYRLLAYVKSGNVELITRNGHDWTDKFRGIARSLEDLKVDSAIIDGEAVVLDAEGRSDFQALQAMLKDKEKAQPVFYAFDLPFCNGVDLRQTPLLERKKKLEEILKSVKHNNVAYSDHMTGDGAAVQQQACGMALEGIISKLADSPYVSRRDPSWLKSKCDQRQEFVIIGYTDPQGGRTGFGALLLGYYNDKKQLVYAGRVGTGFDERMLGDMHRKMSALIQKEPPTDVPPPGRERRAAHWIKPTLVGEVRFTGWTRDGVLRHPAFIALRSDKKATAVVREKPVDPGKVEQLSKDKHRTPSPGIPGEGGGEGSVPTSKTIHGGKSMAKGTTKSKRRGAGSRALTQPSPGVPGEGSDPDTVAGVHLSHPDKVFYADNGVTKHDVAEYYTVAAKWMLPHVAERPLALVRCPNGTATKCFFQRNWSPTLPKDVGKVDVSDGKKKETHVMVTDLPGIVSLVQIGVLEIHTWNCHRGKIENPDQLIFDLDPGPGVTWKQIVQAAKIVRDTLAELKLPVFLKTSGGKGLHLVIPIEPNIDWDSAKGFCETIAKSLEQQNALFIANMRKDLRGGKVYLDYHRNGRTATAVAPYSTRSREGAPVSIPISWEELGKLTSANHFTVETAGRYLEKRKSDPWKNFERSRVDLHKLLSRKAAA